MQIIAEREKYYCTNDFPLVPGTVHYCIMCVRIVYIYFALERQDHDLFYRIILPLDTEHWQQLALILNSVVDSTYHPDADSDFCLVRIRIRLFTLMRIRDPYPDPSFQI